MESTSGNKIKFQGMILKVRNLRSRIFESTFNVLNRKSAANVRLQLESVKAGSLKSIYAQCRLSESSSLR